VYRRKTSYLLTVSGHGSGRPESSHPLVSRLAGAVAAAAPDRRDRLAVAWVWHPGDHPVGGAVTHGRGRARAPRRWSWCWAGDHPGAAGGPAVSAPVCVPRHGLPRPALAAYLANGLLEEALPLRPAAIAMLGPAGRWAYLLVPSAMLSDRLVSIPIVEHMPCSGFIGHHRMLSVTARSARTRAVRAPAPTTPASTGGRSGVGRWVQPEGAGVGDAPAQPGVLAGGPRVGRLAGVADP